MFPFSFKILKHLEELYGRVDECGESGGRLWWICKGGRSSINDWTRRGRQFWSTWRVGRWVDQLVLLLKCWGLGVKVAWSLWNGFNEMLFENKLPDKWKLSSLVPNYKRKCKLVNTNSYRGIKLLEQAFKLY